jgi:hypothetical protein
MSSQIAAARCRDVGEKMQRAVEEGEQAGHAPESDRLIPAADSAQRRDRERDADEAQRPDAGLVGEVAERVRAEIAGQDRPHEPPCRRQRRDEEKRLQAETNSAIRNGHDVIARLKPSRLVP